MNNTRIYFAQKHLSLPRHTFHVNMIHNPACLQEAVGAVNLLDFPGPTVLSPRLCLCKPTLELLNDFPALPDSDLKHQSSFCRSQGPEASSYFPKKSWIQS